MMDDALGRLEGVPLDEVVGAAQLLTRVDNKYVVPVSAVVGLVEQFRLPVLEIDGRRQFRYESVYFDTPDWLTYRAAVHSRRKRLKLRTRTYVDSGLCKLELKSKGHREQTVKQRMDYNLADSAVLNADAHAFLVAQAAALPGDQLAAALTTSYRRSTIADVTVGSRITIDTDLICTDSLGRQAGMPGFAIIETKSVTGSAAADRLLWRAGFRPESLSKYGVGVASLHPALPRNKWHRPLHRYVRPL
jgi:hypothetical protein